MAVTKVEYGGLRPEEASLSPSVTAPQTAAAPASLLAGWSWRADDALRRARYQRLAQPLAASLGRTLGNFSKALGQFQWPSPAASLDSARLVTGSEGLDAAATATLTTATPAPRQEKYLSVARAADAATPLAASDTDTAYTLSLTLGDESREVAVTVPAGADWSETLDAVAAAVNAAGLPVRASVVRQSYPGQALDGVDKVGMFLALSVNPAQADQDLAVADSSGHLAQGLRLDATEAATAPAAPLRYDLRIDRLAKPSSLDTTVRDPGADSGLSAGVYELTYKIADESTDVSVDISSGMTWDQVLHRTADAINSSTDRLSAAVRDAPRVSGLDRSDAYWAEGVYLEVALDSPGPGERMTLAESGSSWLGLRPTANPGSDAKIQVNGRTLDSETGVFSLDQGRVNLAARAPTGGFRSFTVAEAGGEMADRLAAVAQSYNDLSALLSDNADLLDASLPGSFRDPVDDLAPAIAGMGLARRADGDLSFDAAAFQDALAADPASARSLLLDSSGLLSRWATATAAALNGGVAKSLLPPARFADLGPPAQAELRLEESGRLLDVLESSAAPSGLPGLLSTARTLSGLAAAKRTGLESPLSAEGTARLLKLQG